MFSKLKENNPNVFIVIAALCVTLWFRGVNILISHLIGEETITWALSMILISMIVLYLDDKSLNELRNINKGVISTISSKNQFV